MTGFVNIPLWKLTLWERNVRETWSKAFVDDLIEVPDEPLAVPELQSFAPDEIFDLGGHRQGARDPERRPR